MIPIPDQFHSDGFDFRLVERKGRVAIYEKTSYDIPHWEVVVVKFRKERTMPDGRILPASEAYPCAEEWGKYGWTCLTLERAKEKAKELLERPAFGCP